MKDCSWTIAENVVNWLLYSLSSSHQGFKASPRRRRHQFATTITESNFFSKKTEDSNPKALKIKEAEDSPACLKSTSKKERKKIKAFLIKKKTLQESFCCDWLTDLRRFGPHETKQKKHKPGCSLLCLNTHRNFIFYWKHF